ncbi:ABC transporter permease subunit [Mycoplasma phocoenae]|uniref:ABC transporter permease subunit n=1 Tax=Mycoplasma phocoenae TaxID=754517 RepID=A0A858U7U5_9MOLU|nr:ABC transporter permease subunit [Mycoplasma phocoenae]QJG66848.1 ABC transporter permease subunit [Mycoplasma phocoenae]
MIKKNCFSYWYEQNNKITNKKLRPYVKIMIIISLLLLVIFALYRTGFSSNDNGLKLFLESIKNIFMPYIKSSFIEGNLFLLSLQFLWISIKVTFIGTVLGLCLALFTSMIGNIRTNNKIQSYCIRIFILFLRSFPELFYLYLFTVSANGELASILLISWFTWIWLHKFISEAIEHTSFELYVLCKRKGLSKIHILFRYLLPKIKNKIIIFALYSYESNLRWTAIFSTLGIVGIGQLLNHSNTDLYSLHELLIPLGVLILFVSLLEWSMYFLQKHLIYAKTYKINSNNFKSITNKKILKTTSLWLIIVSVFIVAFCLLFTIGDPQIYWGATNQMFKHLLNPNWSIIGKNENIFIMLMDLFLQIYLTVILACLLAYVNLFFTNEKTNNVYFYHFSRFISAFIRIIPTIVLFFTIGLIFKNPAAAFVVVFAIHSSTVISKQLNESIKNISNVHIYNLKKQNKNKIIIFSQYIMPSVKKDFKTLLVLEIEKNIRNFINYGLFAASSFGLAMQYSERVSYSDITPYVWVSIGLIMSSNILLTWVRKNK